MRSLFGSIMLMVMIGLAHGQSVPMLIARADELLETDRFIDAIEYLKKASRLDKDNHEVRYKLATCYGKTLQYQKAKEEYLYLAKRSDHVYRARAFYSYACLVKQENAFELADSLYNFLITIPDAEPYIIELSRKQSEGCKLAIRQLQTPRGYTISELDGINSKFHDFGAIVNPTNNHLVFATTRNLPGVQYEGIQFNGLLPDLVSYENRGGDRWRPSTGKHKVSSLNTQWPEGSGSFSADGQTFYYSSCLSEGLLGCGIMVTYLEGSTWTTPVKLNEYVNEEGSENKHPTISQSGDTLFFSSNRPGGIGGSDLWMSLKGEEKESWTPAINMGAVINTPENEIAPYYSSAFQSLLFASDGHVGYGGFDLYIAKGESFFEPDIHNFGDPFNSTWDDLYVTLSDTVGYLSTNRGDHETLNLYQFEVNGERPFLELLVSGESNIDARLASKYKQVESLDLATFRVEDYEGFDQFAPIRPSNSKTIAKKGDFGPTATSDEYAFEKLYFDYASAQLRPEAKKSLQSLASQLEGLAVESINILGYTDSIGRLESNLKLSEKRGVSAKQYLGALGVDTSIVKVLARGELPSEGANDHWFKRIFKRRVEIIVKASSTVAFDKADFFIVRRALSLSSIAGITGYTESQLTAWNGKQPVLLQPGSTIRLMSNPPPATPLRYLVGEDDLQHFSGR